MRLFLYLFIVLNASILLRAQYQLVPVLSPDIDITAGDFTHCGISDIDITAGDAIPPGCVNIRSGQDGGTNGSINIFTPGAQTGSDISISTGFANSGYAGKILISTGQSTDGGGDITLQTGGSSSSASNINILCGPSAEGSDISLTAGFGDDNGGNINLTPGDGFFFTDGLVQIIGSGTYTGSWTMCSDERLKKNINHLENGLNSVLQLRGVTYEFRTEEFPEKKFNDGKQIGLIAQEVEKVLPEFVGTDSEGYKTVAYQNMVAVLIEAIKEQQKQIENLTGRIENLENKFAGDFVEVSSLNK